MFMLKAGFMRYQKIVAEFLKKAEDRAAVANFRHRLATGEEELVPDEIVARLLAGDSPIRVWREYRGMTISVLAAKASISQLFLSEIEAGKKEGCAGTLKKLAAALAVSVDDLV